MLNEFVPIKGLDTFLYLDKDPIPSKKIRELDFEEYRAKANPFSFNLPAFDLATALPATMRWRDDPPDMDEFRPNFKKIYFQLQLRQDL